MIKRMLAPGLTLLSPGAGGYACNALEFVFTCETVSDGTQKTIYASVKIANNGEVNVCDLEVIRGQIPGMEQDTAVFLPDDGSVDEGLDERYCLLNFGRHTH